MTEQGPAEQPVVPIAPLPLPPDPRPANGLGVGALVTGIVAIVLCWVIVGGLVGIVALVLGIFALRRVRRGRATNRGAAWAAVVLGALSTIIAALVVAGLWTFYSQHRDDFDAYRDCKRAATTEAQRSDCLHTLKNALTG